MQLQTMLTEVRARLGESSGYDTSVSDPGDFWKDSHVKRALNEGLRRFSREEKWPWLYTIQKNIPINAGQTDTELIDDVDFNRHFNMVLTKNGDTTGRLYLPKRVTPPNGIRLQAEFYNKKDTPRWYYMAKTQTNTYGDGDVAVAQVITYVPTPDVAYTAQFHFLREPAELGGNTDEPDLPNSYHSAVVAWATGELWLKELNAGAKAQEQFNLYNAILEQARRDMKSVAVDESIAWGREDPEPRGSSDLFHLTLPDTL